MIILVGATVTEQVDVLVVASDEPPERDRRRENRWIASCSIDLRPRSQRARGPIRSESGGVQDLVGVDVADPGDHVLVEEERLEPACGATGRS